jgi:4-hydroxy-3-polyprenylbenzoate decarboxylase
LANENENGDFMKIILGITGACGAALAKRTIDLIMRKHEVCVVASENGCKMFEYECKEPLYDFLRRRADVVRFGNDDFFAPIANNTNDADGMLILPCSTATLGRIATGSGNTLITRAADVMLKNKKRLVLCMCESSYSAITLKNIEFLREYGAEICTPVLNNFEKIRDNDLTQFFSVLKF